jgi:hypothetical protein
VARATAAAKAGGQRGARRQGNKFGGGQSPEANEAVKGGGRSGGSIVDGWLKKAGRHRRLRQGGGRGRHKHLGN